MRELSHLYTNVENLKEFLFSNNFFTNQKCLIKFFSSNFSKEEILKEINKIKEILPNSDIIGSSSCQDIIYNSEIHNKSSLITITTFSNIEPQFMVFSWVAMKQKEILNELIQTFRFNLKPINLIFSNTDGGLYTFIDKFIHYSNLSDPMLKFVGGIAGKINNKSYVFVNDEIYENGVLALACENLDNTNPVSTFVHSSETTEVISDYFEITKTDNRKIIEIDNIPAIEWFYNYFDVQKDKGLSIKEF